MTRIAFLFISFALFTFISCHTRVYSICGWQKRNLITEDCVFSLYNIVTYMNDYRWGFGLDIEFVDHFSTHFVITHNYSTITDFRISQVARPHVKSFPVRIVCTSSCLVTASDNGYSSASGLKSSLNGASLPAELLLLQFSSV
jgi:hypothetical protein